jgi:DEAD/DEAH box helicase
VLLLYNSPVRLRIINIKLKGQKNSPSWRKASTERQKVIHPSGVTHQDFANRSTERMDFTTSKEVTVAPTFEDMHLKENLLRGIYAYGYESPSAVQSRAIVQICKGRDTIAQAQSGTGKTATFSISILQVLETTIRETQGR